ncbi:ATP-binding protein, partial [Mycobacterium kansasii]
QVMADSQGTVWAVGERECSIQRRHQKVLEEAPSPLVERHPAMRTALYEAAANAAKAIGYTGAGTVEFLVDPQGRHVFIEMNPRIQVEHTVTEEVTDVDLVAAQLKVAAGATLPELGLTQDAIHLNGAALQCRITTEDPTDGFRPDTGRVSAYRTPGGAGIRLDGGTSVGAEISPHFDSMLVKLTTRGRDRETAIVRARRA